MNTWRNIEAGLTGELGAITLPMRRQQRKSCRALTRSATPRPDPLRSYAKSALAVRARRGATTVDPVVATPEKLRRRSELGKLHPKPIKGLRAAACVAKRCLASQMMRGSYHRRAVVAELVDAQR